MVDPDEDQKFWGGPMSQLSLIISIELYRSFWKRCQVFDTGTATAEELLDLKF
jgi:hypothetical protein